jgi:hypothetical protein
MKEALQLLRKYREMDEPVRVIFHSPSGNVHVGLVGEVSILEGNGFVDLPAFGVSIPNGTETWLYIGDEEPEFSGAASSYPPCIGFKLHPKLDFTYEGDFHRDGGEYDQGMLTISDKETGDCLVIMELGPYDPAGRSTKRNRAQTVVSANTKLSLN